MEEFNRILRMSGIYRRRLYIKTWRAVRNIYSKYKRVIDRVFYMSGAAARTGNLKK